MRETTQGNESSRPIRNPIDPRNPLARIYALMLLFDMAEGALRFLVPVYMDAQGLSLGAVGIVTSVFGLATLASRIPAGLLFTPARARFLIMGAGLVSSLAFLAIPFTTSAWGIAVLIGLDGLSWGIVTTALLTIMMTTKPAGVSTSSAMGWYVGFNGIGHALAHTVGGVLGDVFGLRQAFLVLAVVPLVATTLLSLRLPQPPALAESPVGHPRQRPSLRTLPTLSTAVWAAALTALYLNIMNSILNTFFPLLALGIGLSLAQAGALAGIRSGVSAAARFAAIPLLRVVATKVLYIPLLILTAATTALVPATANYAVQLGLWSANGASRGVLRVSTGTDAMDSLTEGSQGLAAGVMSMGLDAGKVVGPILGGAVAQQIGLPAMFVTMPLVFLVLFVVLELHGRRRTAGVT